MKKFLIILSAIILICPKTFAGEENISLLTKQGFFDRPQVQTSFLSPQDEIKKTMCSHLKFANSYNLDGLKTLYAPNYVNADGFDKKVYFDLIKKTWESYSDIKYKMNIKNIDVNSNSAVVLVSESAIATTDAKSGVVDQKGLLQSNSDTAYYLEKINNDWLITSDSVVSEKTFLRYGSAKNIDVDLNAPQQILAGTPYTTSLTMTAPKDSLIIASLSRENITYPQKVAEEVFRKLPSDGILERVFKSNDKNINEYAVASFGVTQAEIKNGTEIKIYVTGLGFVMSRVNVVPKNEFIKAEEHEETK